MIPVYALSDLSLAYDALMSATAGARTQIATRLGRLLQQLRLEREAKAALSLSEYLARGG